MPGGWGGAQYRGPPKAKGGGGEGGEGWGCACGWQRLLALPSCDVTRGCCGTLGAAV